MEFKGFVRRRHHQKTAHAVFNPGAPPIGDFVSATLPHKGQRLRLAIRIDASFDKHWFADESHSKTADHRRPTDVSRLHSKPLGRFFQEF
jgi:hypothetical protein